LARAEGSVSALDQSGMVDVFDPTRLRHDLLRRMADAEAPQRPEEPGVLTKCAEEIQRWFCETSLARLCRWGQNEEPDSGEASPAEQPESRCPGRSPGGATPSGSAAQTDASGASSCSSSSAAPAVSSGGFPLRAICRHVSAAFAQLRQDMQVMLFLAFPNGSPFHDRNVEGLFQWHYTRRWWLCLDWSTLALTIMLVWDVLMNPPYRVPLVLLFYTAFTVGLLLRKVLLFASPPPPRQRRIWHNVLLCAFFFGRCVVCQPLLVNLATEGSRPFRGSREVAVRPVALQVEAFSSVIGLGMTNLSMVFMQQMQTIDMLLFCLLNGVVFILWIIFVLRMPLTDALHTAYVGSIVVTAVCVRQQRDLEDIERRTFDHELLQARGTLVRSADRIAAQASSSEIAVSMHILSRARRVEHINF